MPRGATPSRSRTPASSPAVICDSSLRDPRNLAILLGQAPVLALAIAGLFGATRSPPARNPSDAAQLLLLPRRSRSTWLGAIASSREIIRERSVFERERAVGVGLGAYLVSKMASSRC